MYLLPVGHFMRGYGWVGKILLVEGDAKIRTARSPLIQTKRNIPAKNKKQLIEYIARYYGPFPIRHSISSDDFYIA